MEPGFGQMAGEMPATVVSPHTSIIVVEEQDSFPISASRHSEVAAYLCVGRGEGIPVRHRNPRLPSLAAPRRSLVVGARSGYRTAWVADESDAHGSHCGRKSGVRIAEGNVSGALN